MTHGPEVSLTWTITLAGTWGLHATGCRHLDRVDLFDHVSVVEATTVEAASHEISFRTMGQDYETPLEVAPCASPSGKKFTYHLPMRREEPLRCQ